MIPTTVNLCRGQRPGNKDTGIVIPLDDIDAFAAQFTHNRLNAGAFHADAGADRIDHRVIRNDSNLGALTRFAGDTLDYDDAVMDFGNFHLEEADDEIRIGP